MASTRSFGQVVELDELPLGAVRAFEQAGNHHGLEFVILLRIAFAPGHLNGADLAFFKADDGRIGGVSRLRAGQDFQSGAHHAVVADGRLGIFAVFGVAGAAQVGDDFLRIDRLADGNRLGARVDAGRGVEDRPCHAPVDHARVLHVEVGEHRHEEQAGQQES